MSVDSFLDVALLHLKVVPGALEENRRALAALATQAAHEGARIVVAPELAVSGYLTEARDKVRPYVEPLCGPTCELLAAIARQHGVYMCAGFAEEEPSTGIYYNSAAVATPSGRIVGHHHKVLSERRWASPGTIAERSHFDTPWGRIGLLICADTYCGLLPRTLALEGADLLLVLANWPDCGLDPRQLWRARALENGIPLLACNRTGAEPALDFSPAHSYAVSGNGAVLADLASTESAICRVSVPLDNGRLDDSRRRAILGRRAPAAYSAISLNVNGLANFSGMWDLPKPGVLDAVCAVDSSANTITFHDRCEQCAVTLLNAGTSAPELRIDDQVLTISPERPVAMSDFGPARIALLDAERLRHPEMSVALSKQGCDVVVAASRGSLSSEDRLVLGVKSLDRLAVATLATNGITICAPPSGHGSWTETVLDGPGQCRVAIDTAPLRQKYFEDHLDLRVLLGP